MYHIFLAQSSVNRLLCSSNFSYSPLASSQSSHSGALWICKWKTDRQTHTYTPHTQNHQQQHHQHHHQNKLPRKARQTLRKDVKWRQHRVRNRELSPVPSPVNPSRQCPGRGSWLDTHISVLQSPAHLPATHLPWALHCITGGDNPLRLTALPVVGLEYWDIPPPW